MHFAWLFVTAWKVRYMALFGNAIEPAIGEIMEGDKQHIIDPDTPSAPALQMKLFSFLSCVAIGTVAIVLNAKYDPVACWQ
jgi:hypothetical protein